jgi:CRP-like cAMP-binding protein
VAEALEEVSFPPNHDLVVEGDPGDTFFILKKGEVVVTKTDPVDGTQKEVPLSFFS